MPHGILKAGGNTLQSRPDIYASANDIIFANNKDTTMNLNGSSWYTAYGINFTDASARIINTDNNNGIDLQGGGIRNNASGLQTFNVDVSLKAASHFTASSGNLEFGAGRNIYLDNSLVVTASANRVVTIDSKVANSGGISKSSHAGKLVLSGNNTYSGATTVGTSGTLEISHDNALGSTAGNTTVNSGGTLALTGGITVPEPIVARGAGYSTGGAIKNVSGDNTLSGLLTVSTTAIRLQSDSGTLAFDVASGNAISTTMAITFAGAGRIRVADPINSTGTGANAAHVNLGNLEFCGLATGNLASLRNDGTLTFISGGITTNLVVTNSANAVIKMKQPVQVRKVNLLAGSIVEMDVLSNTSAASLAIVPTGANGTDWPFSVPAVGSTTTLKLMPTAGFDPSVSGSFDVYLSRNNGSFTANEANTVVLDTTAFTAEYGAARVGTFTRTLRNSGSTSVPDAIYVTYTPPQYAPTMISPTVTAITSSGATVGGTVQANGGATITSYGVRVDTSANPTTGGWSQSGAIANNMPFSQAVTGLLPDTLYYYRAFAVNIVDTSYSAGFTTFRTLAVVPGMPTAGTVTGDSITFSPDYANGTGGNPATVVYSIHVTQEANTYYVQENGTLDTSPVWQSALAWGSTVTVTGLLPKTAYGISMSARNLDGTVAGPSAVLSATTDEAALLAAPAVTLAPTIGAGWKSLDVSWSAVATATGYTVELANCTRDMTKSAPNNVSLGVNQFLTGHDWKYTGTSVTVTGLAGQGLIWHGSNWGHMLANSPDVAMESKTFELLGATSVSLSFNHSGVNGSGAGADVTVYVYYRVDGGDWTLLATSVPAMLASANTYTAYSRTLTSEIVGASTIAFKLAVPNATTSGATGRGAAVKDVAVQIKEAGDFENCAVGSAQTLGASTTSTTFTGVSSDTMYWVRVKAANALTDGYWGAAVALTDRLEPPDTLSLTPGRYNIRAVWDEVADAVGYELELTGCPPLGGDSITDLCPTAVTRNAPSEQWSYVNLAGTTTYPYWNGYHYLASGSNVGALQSPTVDLTGMVSAEIQFEIRHSGSGSTANNAVKVQWKLENEGDGQWRDVQTTEVAGGTAGTFRYEEISLPPEAFQAAVHVRLTSASSSPSSAVGVNNVKLVMTPGEEWDTDCGSYRSVFVAVGNGSTAAYNFTGLLPDQLYYVRVRTVDGALAPYPYASDWLTDSTSTLPGIGQPAAIEATYIDSSSMTLAWDAVPTATGYRVELSECDDFVPVSGSCVVQNAVVSGGGVTTTVFNGLSRNSVYYFRVYATDGEGIGGWTAGGPESTPSMGAPASVWVDEAGFANLEIEWSAVQDAAAYEVQLSSCPGSTGSISHAPQETLGRSQGTAVDGWYYQTATYTDASGTIANRGVLPRWETNSMISSVKGHALAGSTGAGVYGYVDVFKDFSTTGISGATLRFKHSRRLYFADLLSEGVGDVTVSYSVDNGSTWNVLHTSSGLGQHEVRDVSASLPPAALNQANVRLRFRARTYQGGSVNMYGAILSGLNLELSSADSVGDYSAECLVASEFVDDGTSINFTGLALDTPYYFRVRAIDANQVSSIWTEGTGRTRALLAPAVWAEDVERYEMTVAWEAVEGATDYLVELTDCLSSGVLPDEVAECPNANLATLGTATEWSYVNRAYNSTYRPTWTALDTLAQSYHDLRTHNAVQSGIQSPVMNYGNMASAEIQFMHGSSGVAINDTVNTEVVLQYKLPDSSEWVSSVASGVGAPVGANLAARTLAIPSAALVDGVQFRLMAVQAAINGGGAGPRVASIRLVATPKVSAVDWYCASALDDLVFATSEAIYTSVFTGLKPGTLYYFRVTPFMDELPGPEGVSSAKTLDAQMPPMSIWAENVRQTSMRLEWLEVEDTTEETRYHVQVSRCAGTSWTKTAISESATERRLAEDDDWRYIVNNEINGIGAPTANELSAAPSFATQYTYPAWAGGAENSQVLAGEGEPGLESRSFSTVNATEARLKFNAARWYRDSSGAEANRLYLLYSIDNGQSWTEWASTPSLSDYEFTYGAAGSFHAGDYVLPADALGKEQVRVRIVAKNGAYLSGNNRGAAVALAHVELIGAAGDYSPACIVAENANLTDLSLDVASLLADTPYYFRVRASAGATAPLQFGAWTDGAARTLPVPTTPLAPWAINIGTRSMTVVWNGVAGAEAYDVEVAATCEGVVLQTLSNIAGTSVTVTGLMPDTRYYFRVLAKADGAQSDWSPCGTAITEDGVDIANLRAENIGLDRMDVVWDGYTSALEYTLTYGSILTSGANGTVVEVLACPQENLKRSDSANQWFYLGGTVGFPSWYAIDGGHALRYTGAAIQGRWFNTLGASSAVLTFNHGRWGGNGAYSRIVVTYSIDEGRTWQAAGEAPSTTSELPEMSRSIVLPDGALNQRSVMVRLTAADATSTGNGAQITNVKLTIATHKGALIGTIPNASIASGRVTLTGLDAGTRYWFKLHAIDTEEEYAEADTSAATRVPVSPATASQGFDGFDPAGQVWGYTLSGAAQVVDGENPLYGDKALRLSGGGQVTFGTVPIGGSATVVIPFAAKDLQSNDKLNFSYSVNGGSTWSAPIVLGNGGADVLNRNWPYNHGVNSTTRPNGNAFVWTNVPIDASQLSIRLGVTGASTRYYYIDEVSIFAPAAPPYPVYATAQDDGSILLTWTPNGENDVIIIRGNGIWNAPLSPLDINNLPDGYSVVTNATGGAVWDSSLTTTCDFDVTGGNRYWYYFYSIDEDDLISYTPSVANADGNTRVEDAGVDAIGMVHAIASQGFDGFDLRPWAYRRGFVSNPGDAGFEDYGWWFYNGYLTAYNNMGVTYPPQDTTVRVKVQFFCPSCLSYFTDNIRPIGGNQKVGKAVYDAQQNQHVHKCGNWEGTGQPLVLLSGEKPAWDRFTSGTPYGAGESLDQIDITSKSGDFYYGGHALRLSGSTGFVWTAGTYNYWNRDYSELRTITNPRVNITNAAVEFANVDLSAYKNVKFQMHYRGKIETTDRSDALFVAVSTNGGATWLDGRNGWVQRNGYGDEMCHGANPAPTWYTETIGIGNPYILDVPDVVTQLMVRVAYYDSYAGVSRSQSAFFIDELRLTGDWVLPPLERVEMVDIGGDCEASQFTAKWQWENDETPTGFDSIGYEVRVSSTPAPVENAVLLQEGFAAQALSDGWTMNGSATISSHFVSSANHSGNGYAFALTGNGYWLMTPEIGAARQLRFYMRKTAALNNSFYIETAPTPDGPWEAVATIDSANIPSTYAAAVTVLDLPARQHQFIRFRTDRSNGNLYIDDIVVLGGGDYIAEGTLSETTESMSQLFSSLNPGERYYVSVRAHAYSTDLGDRYTDWVQAADYMPGCFEIWPDGFEMVRAKWTAPYDGILVLYSPDNTFGTPDASTTYTPGMSVGDSVVVANSTVNVDMFEHIAPFNGMAYYRVFWKRGGFYESPLSTNIWMYDYRSIQADAFAATSAVLANTVANGKGWSGASPTWISWKVNHGNDDVSDQMTIARNSTYPYGLLTSNQLYGAGGNMLRLNMGQNNNDRTNRIQRYLKSSERYTEGKMWLMVTFRAQSLNSNTRTLGIQLLKGGTENDIFATIGKPWYLYSKEPRTAIDIGGSITWDTTASPYVMWGTDDGHGSSSAHTMLVCYDLDTGTIKEKMYYTGGGYVFEPDAPEPTTWNVTATIPEKHPVHSIVIQAQTAGAGYMGDVYVDEIRIGSSWESIIGGKPRPPLPVVEPVAEADGNELVRLKWQKPDGVAASGTAGTPEYVPPTPAAQGVLIVTNLADVALVDIERMEGKSFKVGDSLPALGGGVIGGVAVNSVGEYAEHVVLPGSVHQYTFFSYSSAYMYTNGVPATHINDPVSGDTTRLRMGVYGPTEYVNPFSYTNSHLAATAPGNWKGGHGFGGDTGTGGDTAANSWIDSSGNWQIVTNPAVNDGPRFINLEGYPDATGNAIHGSGDARIFRRFDKAYNAENTGGKFYISFMMAYEAEGADSFAGLSLFNGATEKAFFGKGYGANYHTLAIADGNETRWSSYNLHGYGRAGDGSGLSKDNVYLIVGKYDFAAKALSVKAFYMPTQPFPAEEPSWDLTFLDVTIDAIDRIAIGGQNVGNIFFDEIRYAMEWDGLIVPVCPDNVEPAVATPLTAYLGDYVKMEAVSTPYSAGQRAYMDVEWHNPTPPDGWAWEVGPGWASYPMTTNGVIIDDVATWTNYVQMIRTGVVDGTESDHPAWVRVQAGRGCAISNHLQSSVDVLELERPEPVSIIPSELRPYSVLDMTWQKWNNKDVMIVRFLDPDQELTAPLPVQGRHYAIGSLLGGGRVVYSGSDTTFSDRGLAPETCYSYAFYTVNNDYYSLAAILAACTEEGGHEIELDGDPNDWFGEPPVPWNSGWVSVSEYIWKDKLAEERLTIENNTETENPSVDIKEFRVYADADWVYFLIQMRDIKDVTIPHVALGVDVRGAGQKIDADNDNAQAQGWLGNEAETFIGGTYFGASARAHYPDTQLGIHWLAETGAMVVEQFDPHQNEHGAWFEPMGTASSCAGPSKATKALLNIPPDPASFTRPVWLDGARARRRVRARLSRCAWPVPTWGWIWRRDRASLPGALPWPPSLITAY